MSDTSQRFQTSADRAYEIICENIISGKLPPGTKLTRRKMAKLTGVSMIPVIEALHRLETEGLVESKPHWGSRVIELTQETIQDRYALREAVECQVVRILSLNSTVANMSELRELASELDDYQNSDLIDEGYWDLHYAFHLRMAQFTNHKSLEEALHRINLFQLLQKAEFSVHQRALRVPEDNHMRLVRKISEGNPDSAEDEMRHHIFQSGLVARED